MIARRRRLGGDAGRRRWRRRRRGRRVVRGLADHRVGLVGHAARGEIGALDAPSFLATLLEWTVTSYLRAFDEIEEMLDGGRDVFASALLTGRGKASGVGVEVRLYAHFKVREGAVAYLL